MELKNQCMRVNIFYLSCGCCIHYPPTRDLYVVLRSSGMRETYHLRFILHDLRHVIYLRVDMLASFGIQIHSAHTFCSNSILCFICHLIFSLYLFEAENYDSSYVVSDLHLSDCYLELPLFLDDLCLSLY
jgi:hypothetical protein